MLSLSGGWGEDRSHSPPWWGVSLRPGVGAECGRGFHQESQLGEIQGQLCPVHP